MSSKPRFSGERVRLGDVLTIGTAPQPEGERVWLLNLDMVEKDTGRVIDKQRVDRTDIGQSTVPFDSEMVLYSKLRPNLNKVVLPDEPGYATSELLPLKVNRSVLDRRYLAYLLRSKSFVDLAVSSTAGSKMPRVNKSVLLEAR